MYFYIRNSLKIPRERSRAGSSPASGTNDFPSEIEGKSFFYALFALFLSIPLFQRRNSFFVVFLVLGIVPKKIWEQLLCLIKPNFFEFVRFLTSFDTIGYKLGTKLRLFLPVLSCF